MRAVWYVAQRLPLAAEAAFVLTTVSLRLIWQRGRSTARLLGDPHEQPRGPRPTGAPAEAVRIGRAVDRVADVLPWHPVCLPRAIAVTRMLRRREIACEAHLGMISIGPASAHAWVTVGPTVVQGGPVDHVTEVASFV